MERRKRVLSREEVEEVFRGKLNVWLLFQGQEYGGIIYAIHRQRDASEDIPLYHFFGEVPGTGGTKKVQTLVGSPTQFFVYEELRK